MSGWGNKYYVCRWMGQVGRVRVDGTRDTSRNEVGFTCSLENGFGLHIEGRWAN